MLLHQLQYLRARLGLAIRDENGAVGTEYAILIAFGVLVIAAGVTIFGDAVMTWFSNMGDSVGDMDTTVPVPE